MSAVLNPGGDVSAVIDGRYSGRLSLRLRAHSLSRFSPQKKTAPCRVAAVSALLSTPIAGDPGRNTMIPGPSKKHSGSAGFTLVEIMIVVAIIALLASIAVPGFMRARKRAQASRILNDLRLIDNAIDQYAIENNKTSNANPVWSDLKVYMKKNSLLYNTGKDIFGNSYGPFTVDQLPSVPSNAKSALSDVADTNFWSPYQ